jgi:hypothetical protein
VDARDWIDEYAAETKELQKELGILINPTEIRGVEQEYPEQGRGREAREPIADIPRNPRNEPCVCGSGKKYKKAAASSPNPQDLRCLLFLPEEAQ